MVGMPEDATPARILLVDDAVENRELLEARLTAEGYAVVEAGTGEDALRLAEGERPDLVLLDVMLPDRDGFDICAALKTAFGKTYVPIILVTALEDVDSLERGFEAGADDFITKPFAPRAFMARVRSSLRAKALWDELTATQDKLIEAERMAVIGEMTVTLKHQINNPLQAIIGYADYLLSSMDPSHEFYSQIEAICKGGERISELLGKLDHVRRVATTPYLGSGTMVDLDRSTEAADEQNGDAAGPG